MAGENTTADAGILDLSHPAVRTIGIADIGLALEKGFDDFKAVPTHLIFLCLMYPILGGIFARAASQEAVLPLVFPLLAGYTLIGPFVALGMYELSRRRELGLNTSRWHVLDVLRSDNIVSILLLGGVLMAIYFAWLVVAFGLYVQIFGGLPPQGVGQFLMQILGTGAGWALIIVGSGIGLIFAVAVFTLSVISFPMLLDRHVSVVTATTTSVRVVLENKVTMAIWGLVVVGALIVATIPFFVGLAVVLPVLGHATWHLYRKAVDA